jgi:hypothetical protein
MIRVLYLAWASAAASEASSLPSQGLTDVFENTFMDFLLKYFC